MFTPTWYVSPRDLAMALSFDLDRSINGSVWHIVIATLVRPRLRQLVRDRQGEHVLLNAVAFIMAIVHSAHLVPAWNQVVPSVLHRRFLNDVLPHFVDGGLRRLAHAPLDAANANRAERP